MRSTWRGVSQPPTSKASFAGSPGARGGSSSGASTPSRRRAASAGRGRRKAGGTSADARISCARESCMTWPSRRGPTNVTDKDSVSGRWGPWGSPTPSLWMQRDDVDLLLEPRWTRRRQQMGCRCGSGNRRTGDGRLPHP
eukprot:scaffold128_cov328-Pavlova_lutheri.AAC.17